MGNEDFVLAVAAVFCGNMLTVILVMSLHRLRNVEHHKDAPWLAIFGALLPLFVTGLAALALG